jgi:hypothetical protein
MYQCIKDKGVYFMADKKFCLLYSDSSGLNGVPIFLDYRLWETITDKKFNGTGI